MHEDIIKRIACWLGCVLLLCSCSQELVSPSRKKKPPKISGEKERPFTSPTQESPRNSPSVYDSCIWRYQKTLADKPLTDYRGLSFSDGYLLAFGASVLKLWKIDTFEKIMEIEETALLRARFNPGRMAFTTVSWAKSSLWDLKTRKKQILFEREPYSRLEDAAISRNGGTIATVDAGYHVELWDASTGKFLHTLIGRWGKVLSVKFSPNGAILALGFYDGAVELRDVKSKKQIAVLREIRRGVRSISFHPTGKFLAVGYDNGKVQVWDLSSRMVVRTLQLAREINQMQYSPDGVLLAIAATTHFALWRPAKRKVLVHHHFSEKRYNRNDSVGSVAFHPKGKILALGRFWGDLSLWVCKPQAKP